MIRVAHIISKLYPYAGTEKKVIQILNKLDRKNFLPYLISLNGIWGDPTTYLAPDVIYYDLCKKSGIHFNLIFTLALILKREKINVVHSHNWATIFHSVMAAKLAGVSKIVHGEHGRETKELSDSWKQRFLKRFLYSRINQLTVVNKDLKNILTANYGIPTEKVKIVSNGVDFNQYTEAASREDIQKKIGLNPGRKVLLTIARMKPVKDLPTLIRAFDIVSKKYKDISLVIVGADSGSEYANSISALIKLLGLSTKILLLDQTNSVAEIYSAADIYINSSLSEGMSNTIMEAMANKLPVIASDVGGNPELVINGSNGLLFPVQNYKECADRIELLLTNDKLKKSNITKKKKWKNY